MMSFEDDFKCAVEGLGVLESTFETEMDASGQMNIFGLGNSNWVLFFEEYLNIPIPKAHAATPVHMSDHSEASAHMSDHAATPVHMSDHEETPVHMSDHAATPVHMSDHEVIDLTGQADMQEVMSALEVIDLTGQADASFEVSCYFCGKTEYSAIDASLNMVKYKNCACDHVVHGKCQQKAAKISGIKHQRMTCYVCLHWL